MPRMGKAMQFSDVSFTYPGSEAPALSPGIRIHGRDLWRQVYLAIQFRISVRYDGRVHTAARLDFFETEAEQEAGAGCPDVSCGNRAFDLKG